MNKYRIEYTTKFKKQYDALKSNIYANLKRSILQEAVEVVKSYKEGRFDKHVLPDLTEVESKECVIYVNSVKNILQFAYFEHLPIYPGTSRFSKYILSYFCIVFDKSSLKLFILIS